MRTTLRSMHLAAGLLLAIVGLLTGMLSPVCRGQQFPIRDTGAQGALARWFSTGQLNIARSGHTATLLQDGRVLVAGGDGYANECSCRIELNSAEIYDPVSGVWSVTGSLNEPRSGHTAMLLLDGRVLVLGGVAGVPGAAELYDPGTGSWTSIGTLTKNFGYSATLLRSGKVLIAGGYFLDNTDTAALYDPASGKLTTTGGLTAARSNHTATLLQDGRVLVTGGEIDRPGDINYAELLSSTELYDPIAGTWSRAVDLNAAFDGHIAVSLAKKKVMVLQEYVSTSDVPEEYDPEVGIWTNTLRPSQPRFGFSATPLADGTVLIAGGIAQYGSQLSTAEIYDDRSGTWTTSEMTTGRSGHTATLLVDGRVLIAGGGGAAGTIVGSAELYAAADAQPAGIIGPAMTGAWYDPAQSGHGLLIEALPGNRMNVVWFAFNPAGTQQAWFSGVGTYSGNTATITSVEQPSGGRWIPNFDPNQIVRNPWGTLTFTFADCNHGRVDFNSIAGYGSGGMNLTRLTQPAGLSCR